ncbi:activating signal cointegrator 1 complex subunit 2 homolog [Atheta coriaria]|uniref:activating signal cointegrator 1 complex subunit 2 homolog n=1 Tax=Dalotia coriaria TaxID=877792 RepID=UPI0031F3FC4C
MDYSIKFIFNFILVSLFITISFAQYNPTILQDTRNEPKVDGTFGFLYRTEDGISHAAKGEPGGHVVGRFTYTDPTGLKVNFNYNAGSGVTPKYNYNAAPVASAPVYNNQGIVQEERRTKPPALQQQQQQQPIQQYQQPQQQYYAQPVQQQPQPQPQQQPIQQNFNYQPVQNYQPAFQPVYQPQPLQPQGLQHPLANLQQDPYLPEDDGTYHPELDAQYEYHDSDNTVNNNVNNQFVGFGKK